MISRKSVSPQKYSQKRKHVNSSTICCKDDIRKVYKFISGEQDQC